MSLASTAEGAAFSNKGDGDLRTDRAARRAFSAVLAVAPEWAEMTQVHGGTIRWVAAPGTYGESDGLATESLGLPLAVFTADCFGVVIRARDAVGVAHAGWRGVAAGVAGNLKDSLAEHGYQPEMAWLGPGIRSCCFEVGPEVARLFPDDRQETTWGTRSVDLVAAIRRQLDGLEVIDSGLCTHHDDGLFSHRRSQTNARMAAIGWLP